MYICDHEQGVQMPKLKFMSKATGGISEIIAEQENFRQISSTTV